MVACDHLHPDAGAPAFGDGGDGFGAGRVDQADETDEGELPVEIGLVEYGLRGRHRALGNGKHPLPFGGEPFNHRLPVVSVERRHAAPVAALVAAEREHRLGRALQVDLRMSLVIVVQRGHVAVRRIEGDGVGAAPLVEASQSGASDLARQREQRAFHGIALDLPAGPGVLQQRVVTKRSGEGDLGQNGVFVRRDPVVLPKDRALGSIAVTGHPIEPPGGGEAGDRHGVAGEGAGLVRADHRHRAQRLDGGQLTHDGIAPRHGPHPDGERDGQHGGKPLGDGGHREADDRHKEIAEGEVPHEAAIAQQHRPGDEDDAGEPTGEAVHLRQQRRPHGLDARKHPADLPDLRRGAGRGDDACSGPGGDRRSGMQHRAAIAERAVLGHRGGALLDGDRLAGQHGFLHLQRMRFEQP